MSTDLILTMATNLAGKAFDKLIDQLKDEVGDGIEDQNVRRCAEIGLNLSAQIGESGLDIVSSLIEGRQYDERVLADNLSLREMSDLLDIVQGLEAEQKVATVKVLNSAKTASIQASSILVKAFISAIV